ncbi:hypothetical protein CDAR_407971 [Caerostris darwini]|uniref:Uncharacterized protein n=1 Tax=Caerostris darwini TaxID=1538125 RepID=A0AAV4PZL0_9ARAC|nr:hypothetical protein CDAR_407971 [Caerostris darwini]
MTSEPLSDLHIYSRPPQQCPCHLAHCIGLQLVVIGRVSNVRESQYRFRNYIECQSLDNTRSAAHSQEKSGMKYKWGPLFAFKCATEFKSDR